jgi:hypothetical protein
VFSPQQTPFPMIRQLALQGDRLYFGDSATFGSDHSLYGLDSVTTAGDGLRSVLPLAIPWALWAESDRLLYVPPSVRSAALHAVPVAGGADQVIVQVAPDDQRDVLLSAFGLDQEAFYWAQQSIEEGAEPSLWRGGRDGSAPTMLARWSKNVNGHTDGVTALDRHVVAVEDQILFADSGLFEDTPWVVPKSGGTPRQLPGTAGYTKIIGASPDGTLLWSRMDNPSARVDDGTFTVTRSDVRGAAPAPFWTSKPRRAWPKAAWPEQDGSWLVMVSEAASDGGRHLAAWSVDRAGNGTRLVCDPEVDREVVAGAITPTGRYLAVRYFPLGGDLAVIGYWELVALPAPVAAASH